MLVANSDATRALLGFDTSMLTSIAATVDAVPARVAATPSNSGNSRRSAAVISDAACTRAFDAFASRKLR